MAVYGSCTRMHDRVHGPHRVRAMYAVAYTGRVRYGTSIRSCTRPCSGREHGRVVYTTMYTAVYTARTRPCT